MTAIRNTLHTDPDAVTKDDVVPFIIGLFNRMGDRDYIGEAISQAEHGIQCAVMADQLANKPSLTAAALLHDIGHFLHDFSEDCAEDGIDARHEDFGADFLARFFPPEVVEPVRMHVDAKRYLCAVEPDYFDGLSPASVRSLELQGGPMKGAELDAFAANPHREDAVTLRRCDEGAKVQGLAIPAIEDYRGLLEGLVTR
jgi:phosphonate degradation associated HDIG domain protein